MKHKAILSIQLEIHEVLEHGECSGHIIPTKELETFNIKPDSIICIEGNSKNECLTKVKEFLKC